MRRNGSRRRDVKLGVILSMLVVLVAGGYFAFRGKKEAPILLAETAPPASKQPVTPPKPNTPPANSPTSRFANRNNNPNNPASPARPASTPNRDTPANPPSNPAAPAASLASRTQPAAPIPNPNPTTTPAVTPSKPDSVVSANLPTTSTPPSPTAMNRAADTSPTRSNPITPPAGATPAGDQNASSLTPTPPRPNPAVSAPPVTLTNASKLAEASPKTSPNTTSSPFVNAPALTATPAPPLSNTNTAKESIKPDMRSAAIDSHRVQAGDTFVSLAQSYYGSSRYAKFLQDANPGVGDGSRLSAGTTIKIPPLPTDLDARDTRAATNTAGKTASAANAKTAEVAKSGKKTYTVKAGDSLYKIAKDQLGSSNRWKDIFELNKDAMHGDPTQLKIGQTIALPGT